MYHALSIRKLSNDGFYEQYVIVRHIDDGITDWEWENGVRCIHRAEREYPLKEWVLNKNWELITDKEDWFDLFEQEQNQVDQYIKVYPKKFAIPIY